MREFPAALRRDAETTVELDRTRLLLAFTRPRPFRDLSGPLREAGLVLEHDRYDAGDALTADRVNHTDTRVWVSTPDGGTIGDEQHQRILDIFGPDLDWVGPVYRLPDSEGRDGLHCPLPRVLVTRETWTGAARERTRVRTDAARSGRLLGLDLLSIEDPEVDAYQLHADLTDEGRRATDEILFENMPLLVPLAFFRPNDPLLFRQWNLNRIRAVAPPDLEAGWDIARGNPAITICVFDSGCDLTHPDLNLVPGVTVFFGNGSTRVVNGFASGHGTMCAGVAAADLNNAVGCAGVAGGCTVMPVAFTNFTDVEAHEGIVHAVQNGARVINMSFAATAWYQAAVDPAIEFAYRSNVIMCAATGNNGGPILYPALNPRVIACGATTSTDERAMFSNFGQRLSVMAPGEDVTTTVVQGAGESGGDYILDFWGTSAAAPHVAGLAALLLSLRPALTSDEVRTIIELTADKVGPAPYQTEFPSPFAPAAHPNGSWNEQMGYGRINVHRALTRAQAMD
jgi:subtilisin family serine protease